jgi:hypothetical protein
MNTNCYAADNDDLDPEVLGLITYKNTTTSPTASSDWADALDIDCQDLNYTLLVPTVIKQPPPADLLFEVQFFFRIGAQALSRADINGTQWIPSSENPTLNQAITGLKSSSNSSFGNTGVVTPAFTSNQYVISIPSSAKVIDLIIMNFDDGSHPFHLHGHTFWVMYNSQFQYFPWNTDLYSQLNSTNQSLYNHNPIRRDVITIDPYAFTVIRFLNDVPGMWALHCHNAWHLQAGLMMQILAQPDIVSNWVLPPAVSGLCNINTTYSDPS